VRESRIKNLANPPSSQQNGVFTRFLERGDNRVRTCDLPHVKRMLSQLSYISNGANYTGRVYKKQVFF
jgi:hypothetical protein